MIVTLQEILTLRPTIAAFNVYGYEDTCAVIQAAEALEEPVIIMTNRDAIEFVPLDVLGPMLQKMAQGAKVPVCVHLDHSRSMDDISCAIKAGYTSVMFDGSQLPLDENVLLSAKVVTLAHSNGVSVEAEIGSVGYADPDIVAKVEYTDPGQARMFAEKTGVDALAVAVGTVHRMKLQAAKIDFSLLKKIRAEAAVPLVIHGSSGVRDEDIRRLCKEGVNKINFGTSLRMAFGNTLRETVCANPTEFDRLKLLQPSMDAVKMQAEEKIKLIKSVR